MWFTLLAPLLTGIFGKDGVIGQYVQTKAAKAQAENELALQIQRDKFEYSKIAAQAAVESEKNKLAATSQSFKAISFGIINIPVILTCINRNLGEYIWANLNTIPVWYAQMYVAVVFVIWGLPVVGNATQTIFSSIQDMWNVRNQGKVDRIVAANTAHINEDKLAQLLRDKLFPNGMTEEQWAAVRDSAIGSVEDK